MESSERPAAAGPSRSPSRPLDRFGRRVADAFDPRRGAADRESSALAAERNVLRTTSQVSAMIAEGRPLPDVLDAIARAVESRDPEVICSILLLDGDQLRHGAGPSLTRRYIDYIDGVTIGLGVGCCGEVAFLGRPTEAPDLREDPRWTPYLAEAEMAGLRACWSTPIVDGGGEVLGTFALYSRRPGSADERRWELAAQWGALAGLAITRSREAERARAQAATDAVTGLPNRQALLDQCGAALADASPDRQVAMLFADVDGFTVVNEGLGHAAGDEYLRITGCRLQQVAGSGVTVARFGGDEFVVLATGLASAAEAVELGERLARAVRVPVELGGRRLSMTMSVGVAVASSATTSRMALLRNADAAQHRAKVLGRDRVLLFDAGLHEAAVSRLDLQESLSHAVERHEMHLVYQPKVDLRTGDVKGVEALLRWTHGTRGPVSPAQFIPIAESSGLIVPIGTWVLQQALAEHAARREEDPAWRDAVMWVNVAPAQITLGLPTLVRTVAREAGVPLDRVGLEVTESSLMADLPTARTVLGSLRAMGCRLALDDFGTGYSSLGQLKNLPFHVLKIDKSFVDGVGSDAREEGIAVAVIGLARAHGLVVVAEGVETAAQADRLRDLGCDSAQGYLFARPGPLEVVLQHAAAVAG